MEAQSETNDEGSLEYHFGGLRFFDIWAVCRSHNLRVSIRDVWASRSGLSTSSRCGGLSLNPNGKGIYLGRQAASDVGDIQER